MIRADRNHRGKMRIAVVRNLADAILDLQVQVAYVNPRRRRVGDQHRRSVARERQRVPRVPAEATVRHAHDADAQIARRRAARQDHPEELSVGGPSQFGDVFARGPAPKPAGRFANRLRLLDIADV